MKNLLIYVNPERKFSPEYDNLTQIQIDNSLELGWALKDIILVTNFPYEYRGVKSIIVGDYEAFDQNRSTKIPAINELFRRGLIEDNTIYWFHDHDAFQLEPIDVSLEADAGFTVFRRPAIWNAGSFFFKKSAEDIFQNIWEYMNSRGTNEQDALTYIWQHNIGEINNRYELMGITYNLGIYHVKNNLKKAELPIKVAHFHPRKKHHLDLYRDIVTERLMTIFNKYGIR